MSPTGAMLSQQHLNPEGQYLLKQEPWREPGKRLPTVTSTKLPCALSCTVGSEACLPLEKQGADAVGPMLVHQTSPKHSGGSLGSVGSSLAWALGVSPAKAPAGRTEQQREARRD